MDQKVLLITGASSGFGYGVAEEMLNHDDYIVYVAARRLEKMQPLVEKGAQAIRMDVTSDEEVKAGIAEIIEKEGRIDALLSNAGYGQYGSIEDVSLEDIEYQFNVNVFGMTRLFQAVLPYMRQQKSGRIVMTNSMVSHFSTVGIGWYASTKHALFAIGTSLRQEVRPYGIEVVMIEPGIVNTGFYSVAMNENHVPMSSAYKNIIDKIFSFLDKAKRFSSSPKSTVNAMVKAITLKNPAFIYRSTYDSKLFPLFLKLIPKRLSDWVVYQAIK